MQEEEGAGEGGEEGEEEGQGGGGEDGEEGEGEGGDGEVGEGEGVDGPDEERFRSAKSWLEAEDTDTSDEEVHMCACVHVYVCACVCVCVHVYVCACICVYVCACMHYHPLKEVRNTVGNIPLEWYDDYPHLGYDLDGKRVAKPLKRDEVRPVLLLGRGSGALLCVPVSSWRSTLLAWRTPPTGAVCGTR